MKIPESKNKNWGTAITIDMNKIAPRAKCDQVVYEAIAKVTEIIVRSRCEEEDLLYTTDASAGNNSAEGHSASDRTTNRTSQYVGSYNSSSSNSTVGSNSSARFNLEIEEVESIRKILQMWKRSLHVPLRLDIYYEYSLDGDSTIRKELLERWCIDYVASNVDRPTVPNPAANVSAMADDSIAQLRQVCKRVMVMLRTLYTFIRLMPAFHLHQGLGLLHKRHNEASFKDYNTQGRYGAYGNEAGYYSQRTFSDSHRFESMKALRGRILFTFHASEADTVASDATFLSLNAPFSKRDLNSIPTPYGQLNISVLYDSSLNIERVLIEASQRMSLHRSNAIPIAHQQSVPLHGGVINNSNRPESNIHSLPISTADHDIAHRHIIHDYAASPSLRSRSFSPHIQRTKVILNKSRSTITDHSPYQQEATNTYNNPSGGRVLSGISLALMNDENHPTDDASTDQSSSSPRAHAKTSDEIVLSKQRRAFHQPPPNMTTSTVLQTSHGPMDHSFHSPSLYAYGYNHGRLINTKSMHIPISSTDKAVADTTSMAVNTPPAPAFLGSTPRLAGSFPIRTTLSDETTAATTSLGGGTANISEMRSKVRSVSPPFRNPIELLEAKTKGSSESTLTAQNYSLNPNASTMGNISQHSNALLPPLSSLDVLTLNPFSVNSDRSGMSSGLYFSAVMRQSHSALHNTQDDFITEMPFAIHNPSSSADSYGSSFSRRPIPVISSDASKMDSSPNLSASEVLTTLASRCVTASRLRTFDSVDEINNGQVHERINDSDRSALQSELEKFRSFGLSLTTT